MRNETNPGLTPAEIRDLRSLAGIMIPPSEEYAVPGADDDMIFADILGSLGRDLADVQAALVEVSRIAGGWFADLEESTVLSTFTTPCSAAMTTLGRVILQCYYRDDRVIRSLGLEPRAPFPKGHTLEQGDWSLLDPVRLRPKMWRDAQ